MDIRKIIITKTFGEISGFPFHDNDDIDPVKLQKLDLRVKQHCGEAQYKLIHPKLIPTQTKVYRFPKYEFILQAYDHIDAVVIYNDKIPEDLEKWVSEKINESES